MVLRAGGPLDRLSFRQRLLILFGLAMMVFTAVLAWETMDSARIRAERSEALADLHLRLAMRDLQDFYGYDVAKWSQGVPRGVLTAEQALRELRSNRVAAGDAWRQLADTSGTAFVRRRFMEPILKLRPAVDGTVDALEQALAAGDPSRLRRFATLQDDPPRAQLLLRIDDAMRRVQGIASLETAYAAEMARSRNLIAYGVALGGIVLLFLILFLGLRAIYRDVAILTGQARRIAAHDLLTPLERVPRGELGELARAFTTMQQALAARERELRERELEARAANQAKSLFLAAMSHEIRTPLIGVLGMLELLGHARLGPEQRRQFNIAQQAAHSLLEIIGDILDYSKIEAGRVELAPETVSMRTLASRAVSMFSANAVSKGLGLDLAVDPAVAPAHVADGVRLAQILRNLVGNAIKFTERGSVKVAVAVMSESRSEQRLVFTVSDTGIGMTVAQLGRLFQPFIQAEAGTTRRFGGTGLGLIICRRLADLMGGTISVASTPGEGTTVTLDLTLPMGDPAAIEAEAPGPEPDLQPRAAPTREQAQRAGSLILLAEDHPVNREVLAGQLNLAGFALDTAEDGTRALELFAAERYGLVLTDLHMPGLDGYQLTEAIRELERTQGRPRTPIVALTADVVRETVARCLASGMDDYLAKPLTVRSLGEKLQRWLPDGRGAEPVKDEAQAQRPAVDAAVLAQFGDPAKRREILRLYRDSARQDFADMEACAGRADERALRIAHRIKGAALMIGANEVAEVAAQIEQMARESPNADIASLCRDLRRAFERVEAYAADV